MFEIPFKAFAHPSIRIIPASILLRGTGALAYEMSFPWMGYYFFRLALCMSANWDIAIVCSVAAVLNFLQSRQRPYWHVYQVS